MLITWWSHDDHTPNIGHILTFSELRRRCPLARTAHGQRHPPLGSLRSGVGPNSQVVVKEVGQVVLYEIFPRNPKVKRIPVIKFTLQLPMNIHITRLPQKYITTHTHTWATQQEYLIVEDFLQKRWNPKHLSSFAQALKKNLKIRRNYTVVGMYLICSGPSFEPLTTPPCSRWAIV